MVTVVRTLGTTTVAVWKLECCSMMELEEGVRHRYLAREEGLEKVLATRDAGRSVDVAVRESVDCPAGHCLMIPSG